MQSKLWLLLAVPLGLALSFSNGDGSQQRPPMSEAERTSGELTAKIDEALEAHWKEHGAPAPEVDELTYARRLWLDLLGTIPSFEEVKWIEQQVAESETRAELRGRLVDRVMTDPRFDEVLAERLARIAVGADSKQDDLIYRRRRLIAWLTIQVRRDRPYDDLVRELITAEGLSTDTPAVNFTISQDSDPVKLAARTSRAFLGVRIDCAQCHDHPYYPSWTQDKFEGLAAFYARVETDLAGVREGDDGELEFILPDDYDPEKPGQPVRYDPKQQKKKNKAEEKPETRSVDPGVPFKAELLPEETESRREALAAWLTHPDNDLFARSIVNRLWHWLMGRGLVEPVDELDTTDARHPELFDLLAQDFVEHGYSLRRTIRAIVSARAYRVDSAMPESFGPDADEHDAVDDWRVFPIKPLRGDQLASAVLQAGTLRTNDRKRFLLLRFAHFVGKNEFVKRHADDLDAENPEEETLLQRLHLLNGKTVTEVTKDGQELAPIFRLPKLSPDDGTAVDAAFLMTLTRRPDPELRQEFVDRLAAAKQGNEERDDKERARILADLFWALINTTEFSWAR